MWMNKQSFYLGKKQGLKTNAEIKLYNNLIIGLK